MLITGGVLALVGVVAVVSAKVGVVVGNKFFTFLQFRQPLNMLTNIGMQTYVQADYHNDTSKDVLAALHVVVKRNGVVVAEAVTTFTINAAAGTSGTFSAYLNPPLTIGVAYDFEIYLVDPNGNPVSATTTASGTPIQG